MYDLQVGIVCRSHTWDWLWRPTRTNWHLSGHFGAWSGHMPSGHVRRLFGALFAAVCGHDIKKPPSSLTGGFAEKVTPLLLCPASQNNFQGTLPAQVAT